MGAPTSDAASSSPLVRASRELLPHPSRCSQRLQLFCSCLPPQGRACVGSYATKAAEGAKPCLEGRFSSLRQAFKEELRFPAPRWAFITSHAPPHHKSGACKHGQQSDTAGAVAVKVFPSFPQKRSEDHMQTLAHHGRMPRCAPFARRDAVGLSS